MRTSGARSKSTSKSRSTSRSVSECYLKLTPMGASPGSRRSQREPCRSRNCACCTVKTEATCDCAICRSPQHVVARSILHYRRGDRSTLTEPRRHDCSTLPQPRRRDHSTFTEPRRGNRSQQPRAQALGPGDRKKGALKGRCSSPAFLCRPVRAHPWTTVQSQALRPGLFAAGLAVTHRSPERLSLPASHGQRPRVWHALTRDYP